MMNVSSLNEQNDCGNSACCVLAWGRPASYDLATMAKVRLAGQQECIGRKAANAGNNDAKPYIEMNRIYNCIRLGGPGEKWWQGRIPSFSSNNS